MSKICLVGHVLVDVTATQQSQATKMRLGGIMHAARMLWALECPYSLAYIAPSYLHQAIEDYAAHHNAVSVVPIGTVAGAPNVILIREATEAGDQGYELLLRDEATVECDPKLLTDHVANNAVTDVLVFPNADDTSSLLTAVAGLGVRVHLDANDPKATIEQLNDSPCRLKTFSVSTSSRLFKDHWNGDSESCKREIIPSIAESLVLKENRGGSRYWSEGEHISTPAQVRPIQHSVGVGDCFDAAFTFLRQSHGTKAALAYASSLAAEYAATTFLDDFRESVGGVMQIPAREIDQLKGVELPWENRPALNVYLAGPDFDYVDTKCIDQVEQCLTYHNFTPRRPVQENGQMGTDATPERKSNLKNADMKLLSECQIMVAIMLFDDPGTLIEIGIACERGMPVIVYDPINRCENLMLTELPDVVTKNLDETISSVFMFGAELLA